MSVNIKTVFDPTTTITVSDAEYWDLLEQELVYSVEGGTPIDRPDFTDPQYAEFATKGSDFAKAIALLLSDSTSEPVQALVTKFVASALVGAINGVSTLDATGKVPVPQLPLAATAKTPSAPPSSLRQTLVSVRGWDSRGDATMSTFQTSGGDAAPYLASIAASGVKSMTIADTPLVLASKFDLPGTMDRLELTNVQIQRGTFTNGDSMIDRRGSIALVEGLEGTTLPRGNRSFISKTPGIYAVGDMLLVGSLDGVPGKPANYAGWLRRVIGVNMTNGQILLDEAYPRTLSTDVAIWKVNAVKAFTLLADPLSLITGSGYQAPVANESYLIRVQYSEKFSLLAPGMKIGSHSRGSVFLDAVFGAELDFDGYDLFDQGSDSGAGGYNVNYSGSTRDVEHRGSVRRVRHGGSTNAAVPISGTTSNTPSGVPKTFTSVAIGEPTNIHMRFKAADTTAPAYDTHWAGYGIHIYPDVNGGNGGLTVRCDGVVVHEGSIRNVKGSAINLDFDYLVPAKVGAVFIDGGGAEGPAISIAGPYDMDGVYIANITDPAYAIALKGNAKGRGKVTIRDSAKGVSFGTVTDNVLDVTPINVPYQTLGSGGASVDANGVRGYNVLRIAGFDNVPNAGIAVPTPATSVSTAGYAPGHAMRTPVVVPRMRVIGLRFEVSVTSPDMVVRLAIYARRPTDGVKILIAECDAPAVTSAGGEVTGVYSTPVQLPGGEIFVQYKLEGSTNASFYRAAGLAVAGNLEPTSVSTFRKGPGQVERWTGIAAGAFPSVMPAPTDYNNQPIMVSVIGYPG